MSAVDQPGTSDQDDSTGGEQPWLATPPPPPPGARPESPPGESPVEPTGEALGRAAGAPLLPGGREAARALADRLQGQSPWLLASAALLVMLGIFWFAEILAAFQHQSGLTGQERVLLFFVPGQILWALGLAVAVSFHSAGRHFDLAATTSRGPLRSVLPLALVLAGFASAASAAIDVLVELTNFGHGIDRALSGLVQYVGVFVLAVATTWWAGREMRAVSRR